MTARRQSADVDIRRSNSGSRCTAATQVLQVKDRFQSGVELSFFEQEYVAFIHDPSDVTLAAVTQRLPTINFRPAGPHRN